MFYIFYFILLSGYVRVHCKYVIFTEKKVINNIWLGELFAKKTSIVKQITQILMKMVQFKPKEQMLCYVNQFT